LTKFQKGLLQTETPNRGGGRFNSAIFDQYFGIAQKRCKLVTVTMER